MQKFKTLSDAIALAEFAHRNQVDKAGLPYIKHPERVLAKVQAQGALPYVQMAAILHDVTEDTAFTPTMLVGLGIPESAVEIIKVLDRGYSKEIYYNVGQDQTGPRNEWPNYAQFIAGHSIDEYYYWAIRQLGPDAVMVKLADIEDNLSPWRLSYLPAETQTRLKIKYAKARELLA